MRESVDLANVLDRDAVASKQGLQLLLNPVPSGRLHFAVSLPSTRHQTVPKGIVGCSWPEQGCDPMDPQISNPVRKAGYQSSVLLPSKRVTGAAR
jgi:hypothetical protein